MTEYTIETMVDLETQSTRSDARIIQIGAVNFIRYSGTVKKPVIINKFKVNVDTTIGSVSEATLAWWDQQKANAPGLEESLNTPEPISLEEALVKYKKFVGGSRGVWSNGSNFDTVILENAFLECKICNPFKFWQVLDQRTLVNLFDINKVYKEESLRLIKGDAHDAVVDCMRQVYVVQQCFNNLRKLIDISKS